MRNALTEQEQKIAATAQEGYNQLDPTDIRPRHTNITRNCYALGGILALPTAVVEGSNLIKFINNIEINTYLALGLPALIALLFTIGYIANETAGYKREYHNN